jgi:hypothetical protein
MAEEGSEAVRVRPTLFLSYASEDRAAARLIGAALPPLGIEVWYDESELGGGDAWDQKIRRQIRDCDYFMALVSANTEARHEGYFRREWRLAVDRTLDMADDHLFLLPIVIDATDQATARVPEKFQAVQWLRVPGGRPTPALEALCRRIVAGDTAITPSARELPVRQRTASAAPAPKYPPFPVQEPGHRLQFWLAVLVWALRAVWALFRGLPRWIRLILILWLAVVLMTRGCTPRSHVSSELSPETVARLKALSAQSKGSSNPVDVAKLGAQIAAEVAAKSGSTSQSAWLAIPFSAPAADASAAKFADSAFMQVYGRMGVAHEKAVSLAKDALPGCELAAMLEQGRAQRAHYVVCGTIETAPTGPQLTIKIATVTDGAIHWLKSYPVGADEQKIAADVAARVTAIDDE